MKRFLSFFALWLCSLSAPLRAQSDTQLLFTTGTSTVGTDGQRWIYIVWDSADPAIMAGRCFSVNFRPGTAEDSGNYTRQAVVKPLGHRALTGANALPGKQLLESFLSRGRCLGENMTQLDSLLADSLRGLSTTGPALPPARVDRLAALLAREDAVTQSEALPMLRRLSPSVAMSLGQAWAAPVSVAAGAPVTVELRDFDEGTGTDRGVVGRVTLNVSGLADLPPPGPPVQVPDLTSTGDLNIQMRWGFTPDLARRQAQLQGFTVWRVSKTLGAAQPWIGSAPNVSQMNALVTANPGQASRRYALPRRESALLTEAQAANVVTDSETVFYVDDNDRYAPGGAAFSDGAEYYYFVAAHDLLGRISEFSPGTLMLACRCLPPPVPEELTVTERSNNVPTGITAGAMERVITWKPNVTTSLDRTDAYEVYRSASAGSFATDPSVAAPAPVLLGTVEANAANPGEFTDTSALTLDSTVYWYAVRALRNGPRGVLRSPFTSGAPWAARSTAPAAAPLAVNTFSAPFCDRVICTSTVSNLARGPDPERMVRVRFTKGSADMAWVDIVHQNGAGSPVRLYFGETDQVVEWSWVSPTPNANGGASYSLRFTATNHGGVRSQQLSKVTEPAPANTTQTSTINVLVKTIPVDAISTANPEAASLLGTPTAISLANTAVLTATPEFSILTLPPAYVSGTDVLVNVQSGGSISLGLARVWNGKAVFRPSPFIPATGYEVRSVAGDVTSCVAGFHHRNAPGSTKIQPVRLGFNAPAGMTEYRVYRKVDDGELGMVKHGEVSVPAGSPISLEDVGLPATSACLNYYVQTFDRDGNSSPLQRLGDCVRIVAPLPAPTVSQPTYSGDGSTARVILSWSAPAAGVERFEILADPDDGGEADPDDGGEADPDDGGEIFIRPTAGGLATLSGIWQQSGQPAFTRGYFSARDFTTGKSRRTATSPGRIFVTPYIGTGAGALGAGPVFTQEFDVKPGVDYRFVVTALGTSNGQVQSRSAASAAVRVRWAPPPPAPSPDCTLPWPFRDLPPVTKFHPDIVARRFVPAAGESATLVQGETPIWPIGPRDNWPVGVRIGRIQGQQAWALGTLAGQTTPATTDDDSVNFTSEAFVDPKHGFLNNALFTSRGSSARSSRPLLPVVMYRRQEANTLYPSPPDTIVQCSPRITGLAWQNNAAGPRLRDPNIGVSGVGIAPADLPQIKGPGAEFPPACSVNLYLLDTKPVIDGARYHYYLVAFGSDGAPSEVIDAGTVDIP